MGVHGKPATVRPEDYEPGVVGLLGDALDRRFPDAARDALSRWEALPAAVRGLVTAVCLDRLDDEALGALADWLDEHGESGGARVRLLRPQAGDVLALWCGAGIAGLRQATLAPEVLPPGVSVVALYGDERLEAVHPERLRAAGWVRAEEADLRVRQEREACARVVEGHRIPSSEGGVLQHASLVLAAIRARGDHP